MLLNKDIFSRIDDIVDRAYLIFLFSLIGEDLFSDNQKRELSALGLIIGRRPLIELIYMLLRNRPAEGYIKTDTFQRLVDSVVLTGMLPILNDAQKATIDDSKAAFVEAVETTKLELKKHIKQQIIKTNKDYKRDVTVARYTTVEADHDKKTKYTRQLQSVINSIPKTVQNSFTRSFTTTLTDFINDSIIDAAVAGLIIGAVKTTTDINVYKTVINDGSLCQWCRKFYVGKDGNPIIYKLSELQANGSNYGKPKSEWLATIPATHPRCRCQLHYQR